MTTIAWDGKQIAADKQATGDFVYQGPVTKIFRIQGKKCVAAGTGNLEDVLAFVDWYRNGAVKGKKKPQFGNGFKGFVVKGRKAFLYESELIPHEVPKPFAIGSGCQFAMGAMLAGTSAEEAVKIACKLDDYSGRGVQVVQIISPQKEKVA